MGGLRNQDFSRLRLRTDGSVKLLEDADSIGYNPDTKHVTNGGGGAPNEYALASGVGIADNRPRTGRYAVRGE